MDITLRMLITKVKRWFVKKCGRRFGKTLDADQKVLARKVLTFDSDEAMFAKLREFDAAKGDITVLLNSK